eukprot:COSAG02_NODE_1559_length_11928_cov_2.712233_5_plen_47_part_00
MSQYRVRFSPSTVNFAVRIRHRKYALITPARMQTRDFRFVKRTPEK